MERTVTRQKPLTDEQKAVVCSPDNRLFVEAFPGAGKTTVASERFGVLRFGGRPAAQRSTKALSFTRSATSELQHRIRDRWGSSALAWPNATTTIDSLILTTIEHLLRRDLLHWPGDATALQVIDDWRGHRGYRRLAKGKYGRVVTIDASNKVVSRGTPVEDVRGGFSTKADLHRQLDVGRCTHEELRVILASALQIPVLRTAIVEFVSSSIAHLVVDEVFDANALDLALIDLACEADVNVTLIGDQWQALYDFRGARPDLVPNILAAREFTPLSLSQSFRFQTEEMRKLSASLRSGAPVTIPDDATHDVVLASKWTDLWTKCPSSVLPLSFGRTTNQMDASIILLLDHIVSSRFGDRAVFVPEALVLLGINEDSYRQDGASVLGNVADVLLRPGIDSTARAIEELRDGVKTLGAARRPILGKQASQNRYHRRLNAMMSRLRETRPLVRGTTVHQAKGREWDRVGVYLSSAETMRLSSGLSAGEPDDRRLYVALTRARYTTRRVA
jgi:ATP-dependent DNA helicase UvrD/PcrA